MQVDQLTQLLIYIHAALGGVALLTGGIALGVKKGSQPHKKSGIVFYYSMLISTIVSLVIAMLPNHESAFLFSISVFTIYFLLGGKRSLHHKQTNPDLNIDKLLAYLIILTGITMMLYPLILKGKTNTILLVFGIASLIFGARDLQLFNNAEKLRKKWLRQHLGKMTGGYISAVTAFFVVNELLPGVWDWFAPSIVGVPFIIYWGEKLKKGNSGILND